MADNIFNLTIYSVALSRIEIVSCPSPGHRWWTSGDPCLAKLRVESRNDSAVLVRWFRSGGSENGTEPFYSLDARSRRGGLSKGHHTRGEAWKGRSFFSVLQEPPSLKVNRVDYADRGTYVCDLLYASGRRYSATVALAVFGKEIFFGVLLLRKYEQVTGKVLLTNGS
ncbi:hypothetical protein HPB48_000176 [Haemaphysalis longicornis]|uniref:Ig-like domain-containing protein n=1 Tax=Haemaphysalis longicornis TaxID=44386 RepID=A0A9J6FW21_HAELO|nr:hypothetical protein HPB48_000176 [Haemaphysalis longicornis]